MQATFIAESLKGSFAKKFCDSMTAKALSDLLDSVEQLTYSLLTCSAQATPNNEIRILINPDKFSAEDLISIEDDWVNYIVNDKGLDVTDAIMITPF